MGVLFCLKSSAGIHGITQLWNVKETPQQNVMYDELPHAKNGGFHCTLIVNSSSESTCNFCLVTNAWHWNFDIKGHRRKMTLAM